MLEKTKMTISQVAFEVGFNNTKYFVKYFKEEFNMLPTAYRKMSRRQKRKSPVKHYHPYLKTLHTPIFIKPTLY